MKLLEVAERNTVLRQFGEKTPLSEGSSKTIRFVREEKFTVSSTPTQLTEGIPPDATGLTLNQFEAVMEQYGFLVRLSEVAELTAKHPLVQRTLYLLGLHAAETYDQIIFNVLENATSVYRPNGVTTDATLHATDQVGYNDLVQVSANLWDNAARPFEDGSFVLAVAPQVFAALTKDPDWKASNQFKAPEKIWNREVGTLSQFRVVQTNSPAFAYTAQTTAGYADKVFSSFAIGRFAYQVSDLQNLKMYVVRPGGHTDPLTSSGFLKRLWNENPLTCKNIQRFFGRLAAKLAELFEPRWEVQRA